MAKKPRVIAPPRRIAIVGPESTGKTTLAAFLARRYETTWSPEYLRAFVDRRIALRPVAPLVERRDVRTIALGQVSSEDRAIRRARGIVFHDTNLLTSVVYYEHYFDKVRPAWLEALLNRRPPDLYLLTDIDVPWVSDPQRDRPRSRRALYRAFRAELLRRHSPFVRIFGGWKERRARAVRAVDRLLDAR